MQQGPEPFMFRDANKKLGTIIQEYFEEIKHKNS